MPPTLHTRNTSMVRLAPPLELKLDPGTKGDGAVSGYASAFGGEPDAYGDIIAPGAFTRTVAEHKAAGTAPVMLWSHDQARPIGRWTDLREDGKGLLVQGQMNLNTTGGRDAYAHVKAGDITGLSIGFFVAKGGKKTGDSGTTILTDLDLMEVSVVAMPANRRARLTSKADVAEILRKSGVPREAAARLANGGWPALSGADPEEEARQLEITASRIQRLTEKMRTGL